MRTNAIMLGWGKAVPGREKTANESFGEFVSYLSGLQSNGTIQSFEPVILQPHGGDLQGFFLIRGDGEKLAELRGTEEWVAWSIRGNLDLDQFGVVDAFAGDAVMNVMQIWGKQIQKY